MDLHAVGAGFLHQIREEEEMKTLPPILGVCALLRRYALVFSGDTHNRGRRRDFPNMSPPDFRITSPVGLPPIMDIGSLLHTFLMLIDLA